MVSGSSDNAPPKKRFVSERIVPITESIDFEDTPIGEPPLPRRFTWRKKEYEVDTIIERWKESKPDATHGSGEMYVRKHWFKIHTTSDDIITVYFERQARSKAQRKSRWWLYTLEEPNENEVDTQTT